MVSCIVLLLNTLKLARVKSVLIREGGMGFLAVGVGYVLLVNC